MSQWTPKFEKDEYEPIPSGIYACRVTKATIDIIGNGPYAGLHEIRWEYSILDAGLRGRKIWNNTPLEDKLAFLSLRAIRAIQPTYKGGSEPFDTADVIGKTIEVTLEAQANPDGSMSKFPKVRNVAPYVESGSVTPLHGSSEIQGNAPLPWEDQSNVGL